MSATPLRLGFSPCPNDTFMVGAWIQGHVGDPGLRVVGVMADVEELNARAVEGRDPLEITKLSAAVWPLVRERYRLLDTGAALGRGCGPLVVVDASRRTPAALCELAGARIAIPGTHTTAWLLLRMFGPPDLRPVPMRFDMVMPAVARGEADAGLVIHESRFTYPSFGLRAIADLGELWEGDTGLPLPLGVVAASRALATEVVTEVSETLRRSIASARKDPALVWDYVRAHAQEMADDVCRAHVELYVNEFSVQLGDEGRAAIAELERRAAATPPG